MKPSGEGTGTDSPSGFEEALRALAANYAAELPARLAAIESMLRSACERGGDAAELQRLHRELHNLNGSAKTFGFPAVSVAARKLEHAVSALSQGTPPDKATSGHWFDLLGALVAAAGQSQLATPAAQPPGLTMQSGGKPRAIFLLEADHNVAANLSLQLRRFGYTVRHFESAGGLATALSTETPAAVVADIAFSGQKGADGGALTKIRQDNAALPLIFVAAQGDLVARLHAARAGGDAFFVKPVPIGQLVDRLDSLVNRVTPEPYRVLIVEDSPAQAEYYATVLTQTGMRASVVAEPEGLLEVLNDFNPELVLMDMYLPGCTGDELARVIRQTEAFVSIPIVFLSVERDFDRQLSAMFKGGDEFLTKPILPSQLLSVVVSRVERYRELRMLMLHDSLTGLVNHSRLQQQLAIETARALRQRRPLALALIDIDMFKQVNDRHGHPVGDRVLKNLARFLRQRLRTSDVAGRYGGEEFAVIMSDTEGSVAAEVLDTLREDFAAILHETDGEPIRVTFSAGIASLPRHASVGDLLVAADQALYRAKREGKNRIVFDAEENSGG